MGSRKIVIRVDGNSEIGLGHIYRGIALAEMLKSDFSIEFIIKSNTTVFPISSAKFNHSILPEEITLFDEPDWFNKNYSKNTIIILDGYDFVESYQQKIKEFDFKLVYIDDLAQGTQKADLVINHNPGAKKSDYKTEKYSSLALGIDYAILRPSFLAPRDQITLDEDAVFLCFGGSDNQDLTFKTAKLLLEIDQVTKVNVVIGGAYNNKAIFDLQKSSPKINIYQNISEQEMLNVMLESSCAVASASTVLFELLSIGIPVLSGYYVENQKVFYNFLSTNNYILGVGNFEEIKITNFKNTLSQLVNNKTPNKSIIDKRQKKRIIKKIKSLL